MKPAQVDVHDRLRTAISGWRAEMAAGQETLASQIAQTNTQLHRLLQDLSTRNDHALALARAQNEIKRLRQALPDHAPPPAPPDNGYSSLESMRRELLEGVERYQAAVNTWTMEVGQAQEGLARQVAAACAEFEPLLAVLAPETQVFTHAIERAEALEQDRNALQQALDAAQSEEARLREALETAHQRLAGFAHKAATIDAAAAHAEGLAGALRGIAELIARRRTAADTASTTLTQAVRSLHAQSAAKEVAAAALARVEQESWRLREKVAEQEQALHALTAQAAALREERDALAQQHPMHEAVLQERDTLQASLAALREDHASQGKALEDAEARAATAEALHSGQAEKIARFEAQATQLAQQAMALQAHSQELELHDQRQRKLFAENARSALRGQERAQAAEALAQERGEELRDLRQHVKTLEARLKSLSDVLVESTSAAETHQQALKTQTEALARHEALLEEARALQIQLEQQRAASEAASGQQAASALDWITALEEAAAAEAATCSHLELRLAQREEQLEIQAAQLAELKRTEMLREDVLADRDTAFEALQADLDTERREAERLRAALESSGRESAALQQALAALQEQQAVARGREQHLREVLQAAENTLAGRAASLAEREQERDALQQSLEQLQASMAAERQRHAAREHTLEREQSRLQVTLVELQDRADRQDKDLAHTRTLLHEHASAREEAEQQWASLRETYESVSASLRDQEQSVRAQLGEAQQTLDEQAQLLQQREEERQRLHGELQDAWNAAQVQSAAFEERDAMRGRELAGLRETLEAVQAELRERERHLQDQAQTLERAQADHAAAAAAARTAEVRVVALEQERMVFQERERTFQAEIHEAQEKLHVLRMDQEALETLLEEARRDATGYQDALTRQEQALSTLQQDHARHLEESSATMAEREEAMAEREEALAEREEALAEARVHATALEAHTRELEETLAARLAQTESLQGELLESQARESAHRQQLEEQSEAVKELRQALDEQTKQLQTLDDKSSHLERTLASLRLDNEQEKNAVAEARAFLEAQKETIAERNATISLLQRELRELEKLQQDTHAELQTLRAESRQAVKQVNDALRARDAAQEALLRLQQRSGLNARGASRDGAQETAARQRILVASLLQHQDRTRLGALLRDAGTLTDGQLLHALEAQRNSPSQLLGSVLMSLEYARETEIAQAVAAQSRLPFVLARPGVAQRDALRLLERDLCLWHVCLPLQANDTTLVLAMANPHDETALRKIREITGREVKPCVAAPSDILSTLEEFQGR